MDFPKDEQLRLWSKYLALFTATIICLISWKNEIILSWIIIRAVIAFLIIYSLTMGSLVFFEKTAKEVTGQNLDQGTLLDISLGDNYNKQTESTSEIEESLNLNGHPASSVSNKGLGTFAGQVDPALVNGVVSHQQQADIVRRMGWEE